MPDSRAERSKRLAARVSGIVLETRFAAEKPRRLRSLFRFSWAPLAQAATLLAVLGAGWQASSYFSEIKSRQDSTDLAVRALYTVTEALAADIMGLRFDLFSGLGLTSPGPALPAKDDIL